MRDDDPAPGRDGDRDWLTCGAVWGFLGVAAGTFGAHGLEGVAADDKALEWWATAVLYHLVHALALVLTGLLQRQSGAGRGAGWAFLAGSAVFSGTLYAMALGAPSQLGAVTPLGGVGMLVGWALLARARA